MKTAALARIAAIVILACLGAVVIWRDKTSSAADTDSTAWGASDPTWSPDGKRLAFSLFGSIWMVNAAGGEAEQLTTSGGYHAHPAWSPKDDRIVFINGPPPAGVLPNISGRLAIVDISTGAERIVETPNPTAGTPAWSADGGNVICALRVPQTGALLYEIAPGGGPVRPLQQPTQRGLVSGWSDAAVGAKTGEVYFSGIRYGGVQNGSQMLGAPQIWSMPASPSSIIVQLPLTRYRLTDIAQLHSLSAIPDGSGVVSSAVVVNGKLSIVATRPLTATVGGSLSYGDIGIWSAAGDRSPCMMAIGGVGVFRDTGNALGPYPHDGLPWSNLRFRLMLGSSSNDVIPADIPPIPLSSKPSSKKRPKNRTAIHRYAGPGFDYF